MAGVLQMPATYTATVREFERLAAQLRRLEPTLYWHLSHWYWLVDRTQKLVPRAVKRRNKKTEWKLEPRIVTYRHKQANQAKAREAVEWLADHWTAAFEPMLPDQILPDHDRPRSNQSASSSSSA